MNNTSDFRWCWSGALPFLVLMLTFCGSASARADLTDELFVTVQNPGSVARFDISGMALTDPFVAAGGCIQKATGAAFGPDGNLYVASFGAGETGPGQVLKYDGFTGEYIGVFVDGIAGRIFYPRFGPDNNLYLLREFNNFEYFGIPEAGGVLRFDGATGQPLPAPGRTGADFVPLYTAGLKTGRGIAFGRTVASTPAMRVITGYCALTVEPVTL